MDSPTVDLIMTGYVAVSKEKFLALVEENGRLKEEVARLKADAESLHQLRLNHEQTIEKLHVLHQSQVQTIEELRRENAELKAQIAELRENELANKRAIADLRAENTELKVEVSELRAENTQLKVEVSELRAENTELKASVSELRAENTELKASACDMKAKIANLEDNIYRREHAELAKKAGIAIQDMNALYQLEINTPIRSAVPKFRRLRRRRNDGSHYVLNEDDLSPAHQIYRLAVLLKQLDRLDPRVPQAEGIVDPDVREALESELAALQSQAGSMELDSEERYEIDRWWM